MSKSTLYYLCLLLGGFLVIVTEFQYEPDLILQLGGFCLLMLALFQISKSIKNHPSKELYSKNDEEE